MANEDTLKQVAEVARLQHYRQREQGFVASHIYDVPGGGGTVNLFVRNPADSGFVVDVVKESFTSQFKGEFAVYDQFAAGGAPSGGTDVGVDNLLMDSGGTNGSTAGGVTVKRGVSFTPEGSPHFQSVIPSGGGGNGGPPAASVGGAAAGTEPLIEPGREVVYQLQNDATEDSKGSLGIVYLERDDL
ncbi:hypothetical protein M1M40_gp44 [Halorubrum tailed virus 29]|uniref:Uncharacterized protein n=1 Tax=Halorubrum tailed virus 29 TaxID=2878010 RepID=A0AAE8XZQ3_9CAUD|nr:hypothetical protein M1M40_gp44 [Halorubrum tailed virus 29]UBF23322.1 hypothetical protein HRTV-29_gp44 [Halorubrum tailed virus 29]